MPEDRTESVRVAKTTTNGAGGPAETTVSVREDTPGRQGSVPGNGSAHAVPDTQPVRRPIISVTQPSQDANLHVGKGVKLKGEITSCGVLTIEGKVEAEITAGHLQIAS